MLFNVVFSLLVWLFHSDVLRELQCALRQTLHRIMRCSCAAAGHAGQTQQSGVSDLILFCFSVRVDEEIAQMDVRGAARQRSSEVDERSELEERRTAVRDAVGRCYSDISLEERELRDGRSMSFTRESDVSPEFIVTSIQRSSTCLLLCDI